MSEQYFNFIKRSGHKQKLNKSITWEESVKINEDYDPGEPDYVLYPGA